MSMRAERPERILWRPDEIEEFDEELESILWIKSSIKELHLSSDKCQREIVLLARLESSLGQNVEQIDLDMERVKSLPYCLNLQVSVENLTKSVNKAESYAKLCEEIVTKEISKKRNLAWLSFALFILLVGIVSIQGGSVIKSICNSPFPVKGK